MQAKNDANIISLYLNEHEALVFLEWLHNFNEEDRSVLFQDKAEERLLFDFESELEKVVSTSFEVDYLDKLEISRRIVADN